MLAAYLALGSGAFGLLAADPPDRVPALTGIFPPGVTYRTKTTWTITGRDLDRVRALRSSEPVLSFGPLQPDPSGRSLVVEVEPRELAANGTLEIRADGPAGVSNLALVRVDELPQVVEVEPNDQSPAPGQVIAVGTAVAGVIRPLDVDRFRVEGTPGQRVTLDWETRRLGTAIMPVLTVTGPDRVALGQARSLPGGDRDCRTAVVVPPAGWFEVELRDNTYGGDDRARYRLRVDPLPYATAIYPLGGVRSEPVALALAGRSLPGPLSLTIDRLPAIAGTWLEADRFGRTTPTGSLLPPMRLRVGDPDWPEVVEPAVLPPGQPWDVLRGMAGVTVNGRIDQAGQVDRFRVEAKAGDRFRARVEAAAAGSWLDSVVTVLSPRGDRLAENDDAPPRSLLAPPTTIDGTPTVDSEVDVTIREDGPITIELADRFGAGGPEYGYRLELGPPRDDFSIHLIRPGQAVDFAAEARSLGDPDASGATLSRPTSLAFGAVNLRAAGSRAIPFVIIPRGRPGTIEVSIHTAPTDRIAPGSTETIRTAPVPRVGSPRANEWDAPPVVGSILLKGDFLPSSFRIEARQVGGRGLRRLADAVVGVDAAGGPGRPVVRSLTSFPVGIVGED